MWLFTKYGFYSAVLNSTKPGTMVIRSREREHLVSLRRRFRLSKTKIESSLDSDYRFRVRMRKKTWKRIVTELAHEVDYCNFKDAVFQEQGETEYELALHQVWQVMARTQPTPPYFKTK